MTQQTMVQMKSVLPCSTLLPWTSVVYTMSGSTKPTPPAPNAEPMLRNTDNVVRSSGSALSVAAIEPYGML